MDENTGTRDSANAAGNRRAYLREDDELLLRLRRLDEAEYRSIVGGLSSWRRSYHLALADELPHAPRNVRAELEGIRESLPELAAYVRELERQVAKLSAELDVERRPREQQTAVRVNLSAQGMRCRVRDALEPDERVEIGLILMPERELAVAIGRVIRVGSEDEQGLRSVAINFDHIHESDQDRLVRHVYRLHRESLALQRRVA